MQITVCVAIAPATDARIKVAADGRSIDPADVKFEMSAYDEFALEEALRIKEARGEGDVRILTVDDGSHKEEVRKGLARGADRATILKADMSRADSFNVARALAEAIRDTETKLVFCGKQVVDGDSSQVPAHIGRELHWPVVTKVSRLELDGDSFTAEREIEGGVEVIQGTLPAVFSAEKGLNEPRYPSLKGIMQAKKKPLDEVDVTLADPRVTIQSIEPPPERPAGRILGEGVEAVGELVKALKDEAKVI